MQDDQPFTRTGVFRFLNFWSSEPLPPANQSSEIPPNPKGFFANERTFLSWMQLCLILGTLGIGFINFGGSSGGTASGFVFMIITIGMMFYALTQYHIRLTQLKRKGIYIMTNFLDKGMAYEDIYGTFVLVGVVFFAVLINFVIHFVSL
jgi:uncharacterized membrane protein YidH (DUF202 family)